jgi:3-phytase
MRRRSRFIGAVLLTFSGCTPDGPVKAPTPVAEVQPAVRTEQVADDPDDPAIWVHPGDPAKSLVLGTNKIKAPGGALFVFGLDGPVRQKISGLDRPNNVDVEYGMRVSGEAIDIAVVSERLKNQLRIFRVTEEGLTDITSAGATRVFSDRSGEQAAPMGIALYRRPSDGVLFAIVAPKNGPREGYLGQYRLDDDGNGRARASFVRYFGKFGGVGEIEAVAVDDQLGYVYYSDEGNGIHKYHADPDHADAARELAHFGMTGFRADREGLAIYALDDGTGYIVCADQLEGSSEFHVYRREGEPGRPHDHHRELKIVRSGADSTDGLEITSTPLPPSFPAGLVVAMNSSGRNFLFYRWDDLARAGSARLAMRK